MLLSELTETTFGYSPDSLSDGNHKKVMVKCDYCGITKDVIWKNRVIQLKKFPKDSCRKCKFKKMAEMGKDNPFAREEVKEKIKKTCQEKYGTDAFTQTEEFKQKARKTNLERYGVANAQSSPEVKKRKEETTLKKYGVKSVLEIREIREEGQRLTQTDEVKEKIRETCQRKYGADSFFGSEVGEKVKQEGIMAKYGVANAFQSEEVKAKIRETNLSNFGVDHPMKNNDIYRKAHETKRRTGVYRMYEGKTTNEWAKELGFSQSFFLLLVTKYGFEYAIQHTPFVSYIEKNMRSFLDSLKVAYIHEFRVGRKLADFYIPSANLIIELDGLYWHSEEVTTDNNYHMDKKALYDGNGYRSLFFREDELNGKISIVESIIKNKLNLSTSLYARECTVTPNVNRATAIKFFEENHLMGVGVGQCYALVNNEEIVAAIQVKRVKNEDYEISRFATKSGVNVVGGFSRLISKFKYGSLTTFVDRRYGEGHYLEKLGFKRHDVHKSFKWTNGKETFHRLKFPGNSGYDSGLTKIWDCGQAKFVKSA